MYIGDLCTLPSAPVIVSLYEVCNFLDLIMQYFESCGKVVCVLDAPYMWNSTNGTPICGNRLIGGNLQTG